MTNPSKKKRVVPWLLVILPLWLVGSGIYAIWLYFEKEPARIAESEKRFARNVSTDLIADDLGKIVNLIGERNTAKPAKLASTAAMIQGILGPSNTGYQVRNVPTTTEFPLIHISVPATGRNAETLWIVTSYDSPPGSKGAEKNATGLAATIAAAQTLVNHKPSRALHFLFIPHLNDPESPLVDTAAAAATLINQSEKPTAILCIEAMGAAETLILSSPNAASLPVDELDGLGEIPARDTVHIGDAADLSTIFSEMNLSAIRVATRPTLLPDETDDRLPFAPTLAASSGRLIELITRLAN